MDESIYYKNYDSSPKKQRYKGKKCVLKNCSNHEGLDAVPFFNIIRQDKGKKISKGVLLVSIYPSVIE